MLSARLICAGLAFALLVGTAVAKKLDKPICDDLKVELGLLQQKGVAADLAKGPDWGKANASRDRLKEIERLIFVEEQLAFRCGQLKRPLPSGDDDDGDGAPPAKGTKGTAQAKAAPAAKPSSQPKATQPKADSGETPAPPAKKVVKVTPPADQATTKEASAAPRPAAKPKPKPDDAFSPASNGQTGGSAFPNN